MTWGSRAAGRVGHTLAGNMNRNNIIRASWFMQAFPQVKYGRWLAYDRVMNIKEWTFGENSALKLNNLIFTLITSFSFYYIIIHYASRKRYCKRIKSKVNR